ncbi:CAP domain-containing protein [Streptomyces sp. NBC_01136]|uniref:CAP domain-containing protein n=1 Tax=unclassified Streptomyces TaxID=2593676 RepID=UPI0032557214|nr:CAP domain-containing protein [Streptomyces sp. NBC_01136]
MRTNTTRIRRLCAAACTAPLLVFAGAAGAGATAAATAPAAAPGALQVTGGEILQLVNAERGKANCPALNENAQLTQAAKTFADDAEKNNLTNHTGSDGSSPQQRIKEAGYNAGPTAENMAWGSTDAKKIVDDWMGSSGHRANIVNCALTDTGVAVSGKYTVQVFAAPG